MSATESVRKVSPETLDKLCDRRGKLRAELDDLNDKLKHQVDLFGFTPPGAEKSKRLTGTKYQATVSYGETTEIRDAQVETIERVCPENLFTKLFRKVMRYKLESGASLLLAGTLPDGAPPNLRRLFAAAVILKPRPPSLSVEKLSEDA
jgi:hypothetical protein